MMDGNTRCKNCGTTYLQHDPYAQAIGAKSIHSWADGTDLPVTNCHNFVPNWGTGQPAPDAGKRGDHEG